MRNPQLRSIARRATCAVLCLILTPLAHAQTNAPSNESTPPSGLTNRAPQQAIQPYFAGYSRVNPGVQPGGAGMPGTPASTRPAQAAASDTAVRPSALVPQAPQPPSPVPPTAVEPGLPGSNLSDLSLPAAERGLGGGEPTESALEAEAAAEGSEDTRGLLMKFLDMPQDSDWRIYGWIQNSYTGNTNGFGNGINFGVNPNWKTNSWMGNQYYMIFEKPLKQDDTVNWGFRIDNLFGNDWQFNFMQGLFNGAFTPGQFAGYDMAQLFGELHLPFLTKGGIDIKGGRFYTLAGYEVVPATGRPLLSVPYMFNYGQPFTHFGVLTTLHLTDRINIYNAAINGWDRWIDINYQWGYMGGFAWTSKDEKTSLAFTTVWGPNQYPRFLPSNQPIYATGYINIPSVAGLVNPGYHRNDRTLFTTVLTRKWTDKFTQVLETDQGWERSVPGLGSTFVDGVPVNAAPKDESWYSFGNWFLYNFSDKVMGVWRSEVFWDTNGGRTAKIAGGSVQRAAIGDRYYEMTVGAQIKPYEWLWIRPEARYDWSQYHPSYNNDTRKSQLTLACDVIFLF